MVRWHIGCSGFHYKHWKGSFYPEKLAQSKWFDYYNDRFKTLELNVSFFRFPRLNVLEDWYNKSPADFCFSVKVFKGITHYKQFVNTKQMIDDFYGIIREGLREKLGCILFQMPPRIKYKEEKLQQILEQVDDNYTNVLEFRNESWWNPEVYNAFSERNITFCGMSHPDLPEDVIQNTKTVYFRFHGVPRLYQSKYEVTRLEKIADEIDNNPVTKEAYIYFNNDIDASAITNAFEMDAYVRKLRSLE
jgi:uncharacterized protein YecE (DUF72 family)